MKGKVIVASVVLISFGLATLSVFGQNDGYQKKYVERVYEPGNFSKNFNRLPEGEIRKKTFGFALNGVYKEATTLSMLANAESISDIISNFPGKVKIINTRIDLEDGSWNVVESAHAETELLSKAQLALLQSVALEDELSVFVNFTARNEITRKTDDRQLRIRFTVIPEVEAEYSDGNEAVLNDFKAFCDSEILPKVSANFEFAYVEFIINEAGETEAVRMKISTDNETLDAKLLNYIENLKGWTPAQDVNGENVKQRFEFSISSSDGC